MERYQQLRRQYPRFLYRGYETEEDGSEYRIRYRFETEGLAVYEPTWRFPKLQPQPRWSEDALMRRLTFSLGMVELVSYWKLTCSPQVVVEAGMLDAEQIAWWKDLYFNGLGEFFYVNGITEAGPQDFMEIVCASAADTAKGGEPGSAVSEAEEGVPGVPALTKAAVDEAAKNGVLVPIGGGKDSAVTLELLRRAGVPLFGYIINPRGATTHTAEAAGLDASHVLNVRRTLDRNMLELNKQGFLNGHTPFSALVAFSSLIAARMAGLSYVALSNESSANESTVLGSTVNHQYSKSFKFEEDFHRYQSAYLPGSAYYFSMLRPLSEFQIARYFAAQKQYHAIFRSCNAGSKTDSWCGYCPKCLFVGLILSPFLPHKELTEIFGRDMLEDMSLKPTLEQLVGIREEKPFECVGSRDEVNAAITMTIGRMEAGGEPLPALLAYYKGTALWPKARARRNPFDRYFDRKNLVPAPWEELVRRCCADGGRES